MLKVLIVDDERNSRELLHTLVSKYYPTTIIIGMAQNIIEAQSIIEKEKPDLIFLDIELGGSTGFDFLDTFDYENVLVCFVTGYDQYAIRAIKYRAFDYLLKPIDIDELKKVMSEAIEIQHKETNINSKITINEGLKTNIVDITDIIYVEVDSNYSTIHLESGKKLLSSKSLSYYNHLLPKEYFHRTHKSFIVSLLKIKEIAVNRTGQITLNNGVNIPIASRRVKEFKDKISLLS